MAKEKHYHVQLLGWVPLATIMRLPKRETYNVKRETVRKLNVYVRRKRTNS